MNNVKTFIIRSSFYSSHFMMNPALSKRVRLLKEFLDTEGEVISHHDKLMKMLNAQSKVRNINEHRFENEENVTEEPVDSPVITGEAVAAMNDVCDINAVNHIIDLDERIAKLKSNICEHFNHQYRHEHNQCVCNDFKQFTCFLVVLAVQVNRNH